MMDVFITVQLRNMKKKGVVVSTRNVFYLKARRVVKLIIALILISCIQVSGSNSETLALPIKGIVSGTGGEPLPGVSVTIKGTQTGTSTDASGNYSIDVEDPNAILVISYVGYETQEVAVAGKNQIDIVLAPSQASLNAVVVVGYGTQRKRDLTGAITQVRGEEIAKLPNVNPISSLQGRVAGLTIVNSGSPGASPTVRIRGVNSVNSASPLYVVDGVHQSNIDYLNPADIESIEVLRDPSSIAIFGLQGGNGVIVVTTKRALRGQTRVSFQSSSGVQKVLNTIDVVDAEGFKKLYTAQLANLGAAPFDFTNYTGNTNWQDEILRTAFLSNNNISFSNSGEKSTTLISVGYNTQQGVVKFGKYQRYVARINEEIKVTDNFKIGADLTGTHWILNGTGADLNNALWAAPIVGIRAEEDLYYAMPSFQRAQVGNPVARLYQTDRTSINKGYRVVGNLFAEFTFLKKFKLRSQVYTDLGFNNSRGYGALPFGVINLGEGSIPTDTFRNVNARTSVNQRQEEFRKFQQDHTITYTTSFNKVHKLTALAGFTSIFEGSTNISGNRTDVGLVIPRDPSFWYIGIAEPDNPGNFNGEGSERSSMGLFARANYSFSEKYLLNATFRRDGISRLSPTNRWGNFGGVGLGWVISEEAFFSNMPGINFLKLRGAWGTVGNAQGISDNIFRPGLTTSGSGVFGDNIYPSVAPAYIPDPFLRWEVVRGIDIGLDVRAFNNRLTGEINLYDRTTKDIITTITLLSSFGSQPYRTNLGSISNKGVEVSIGWNDRIGKDFTYGISPNFSYNQNKVESIGNNFDFQILGNGGVNRTISGESIGHFYGYRQTGVYQTTADLDKKPGFPNSLPGDISYADLDGDGIITTKDREHLGSPFPDWNFGINLTLGYKGFDALIQGQGVAGNAVYTQRRTNNFAVLNYESNRINAWTAAGTTNVEPMLDNTRGNNYLFSTYFLEPGDYFRLRTVQLGYSFSKTTLTRTGLKNLRLYLSAQNVHTWSQTTGYSPEAPISNILGGGADNGVYPVPAIYTFGINATF